MSEQTSTGEWMEDALCMRLGIPTDFFLRGRHMTQSQQSKRAGIARSAASASSTSSAMRCAVLRRLRGFLEDSQRISEARCLSSSGKQ